MDSQDEYDHGVHPEDPNIMGYQKIKVGVCYFLSGVSSMLMQDALEVL